MAINDAQIKDIVQKVMANLKAENLASKKDQLGIFEDMNEAIEAAKKAQKVMQRLPIDVREKIISNIRKKTIENAECFARMGVEETGMGCVEDKVIKNHYASEYIYNTYKDTKTCGVIEEEVSFGIKKIVEPA